MRGFRRRCGNRFRHHRCAGPGQTLQRHDGQSYVPNRGLPAAISSCSPTWRCATSGRSPAHALTVSSDLHVSSSVADPEVLVGFLFLALLLFAIYWTARRPVARPISFGLSWFVLALAPTSLYPLSELENDHRMFFPFVGLVLAVVWAGSLLPLRRPLGGPLRWPPSPLWRACCSCVRWALARATRSGAPKGAYGATPSSRAPPAGPPACFMAAS